MCPFPSFPGLSLALKQLHGQMHEVMQNCCFEHANRYPTLQETLHMIITIIIVVVIIIIIVISIFIIIIIITQYIYIMCVCKRVYIYMCIGRITNDCVHQNISVLDCSCTCNLCNVCLRSERSTMCCAYFGM